MNNLFFNFLHVLVVGHRNWLPEIFIAPPTVIPQIQGIHIPTVLLTVAWRMSYTTSSAYARLNIYLLTSA